MQKVWTRPVPIFKQMIEKEEKIISFDGKSTYNQHKKAKTENENYYASITVVTLLLITWSSMPTGHGSASHKRASGVLPCRMSINTFEFKSERLDKTKSRI